MKVFYDFNKWPVANVLLLGLLVSACTSDSKNNARMGEVTKIDLVQKVSLSGSLRGKRSSYIYPGYSGYVTELTVKLGDRVREGAPLFKIVQTANQPTSQVFPIRAPFSGVVTQTLKKEGEFANSSNSTSLDNAILRLDDLSEFWVDVNVPEIDIAKIKVGLEALIRPTALNNVTYPGVVKEISLSARGSQDRWDRGKVEFPVLIKLSKFDEKIMSGMSTVVEIVSAKSEGALVLPHEFVHHQDDRYFVVDQNNNEIDVQTALSNESYVQIVSGVSEGLKVQMIDFSKVGKEPQGGRKSGKRTSR